MAAKQAEIASNNGSISIRDLDSPGGTFVNRQRILPGQSRPLQDGDVLQLGTSDVAASLKSASRTHLNTVLTTYAAIEFFAIAFSAFLGSTFYHYTTFHFWQINSRYILAAAVIATLNLLISAALHNFFAFRRQPRHVFLWKGIGSVGLSFSAFLTILFFTQAAEAYSRGSLIFQMVYVSIAIVCTRTLFLFFSFRTQSRQIELKPVALP